MLRLSSTRFLRLRLLPCSLFALGLLNSACKKTVVSDRVVPMVTSSPTAEPPRKGIGDGMPDTTATVRLTGTRCSAERITEFEVKVAGLKNTEWTKFTCSDKSKEIRINTKSGYCNILQLRARVSMTKTGLTEEYVRETAKAVDQQYFIVDQNSEGNARGEGINIHFEDTTDAYWNKTYQPCVNGSKSGTDLVLDVIEGNQKTCTQILGKDPSKPAAVDWDDFEFSVESDQVQFSVESFPNIGCSSI